MKISNILSILILLLLFKVQKATSQTPAEKMGQLQVKGTQLTDKNGNAVRLDGVSFGWSCFHPRFYNQQAVKWLKEDWKVNVVRAAMGIEPKGGYLDAPSENIKLIESVADAAIKEGIYVIIDWHAHDLHTEQATQFFDRMSKKYGKFPNVLYEVFNEPDHETWPEVKAYAEAVIGAIRKNDPDNIILVGSPQWDQRVDLPAADPIKEASNIMYTMHFYAGTHRAWLRERTDKALQSGLPIFISESGPSEADGNGTPDYKEWKEYLDWMKRNNLSWISWSLSDKAEICSMLLPSASSSGKWKASDLNVSGTKTREALRKQQ